MNTKDQLDALLDATAFDSTGTKIGAVRQIYVDDSSGKVTFATVATGIFSADAIVPLHGARLLEGELHIDHTRSVVRDSPRPGNTEDGLTPDQEATLLEHYGIEPPKQGRPAGKPETKNEAGVAAEGKAKGASEDKAKNEGVSEKKAGAAQPANSGPSTGQAGAEKVSSSSQTPDTPTPTAAAPSPKPGTPPGSGSPTTRPTSPIAAPGKTGTKGGDKSTTTTPTPTPATPRATPQRPAGGDTAPRDRADTTEQKGS